MEEYRNELLDKCVGLEVLVRRLTSPPPDDEFFERLHENPTSYLSQPLRSSTSIMVVESYDRVGVVLRTTAEDAVPRFVPWSAVIELTPGPVV